MRVRLAAASLAATLATLPAFAQGPAPQPDAPVQNPAMPTPGQPGLPQLPAGGAPGVPLAPATGAEQPLTAADFVAFAAASDLFEIQASRMAVDRGSDAVRMLAQKLVAAHTLASQLLPTVLERAGMTQSTTPTLSPEQEAMVDQLTATAPEAFDQTYLTQQAAAHRAAIAAFTSYAANGDNETLRTFAEMMIPALQAHLAMIEGP